MPSEATVPAFRDPSLPASERAADLVSRMTLAEKVSQSVHDAFAVPRLGIPAYNWWNECLQGVGRALRQCSRRRLGGRRRGMRT